LGKFEKHVFVTPFKGRGKRGKKNSDKTLHPINELITGESKKSWLEEIVWQETNLLHFLGKTLKNKKNKNKNKKNIGRLCLRTTSDSLIGNILMRILLYSLFKPL